MANKKKRRRKRSPIPVIICILSVIVIALAAAAIYQANAESKEVMDARTYFGIVSEEEAAVIMDDKIREELVPVRNQRIYLPFSLVEQSLNKNFFWQKESSQMLLTMPDGTHTWTPGDSSGDLLLEGDTLYLAADCVKEYSDIDLVCLQDPYRVMIRTRWENVAAEKVLENTEIRFKAGPKNDILTTVAAGDVVVLTENGDDWCQVASSDGFVGYIRKKEIEAAPEGTITHTSDAKFTFPKKLVDFKVNMGWMYVNSMENNEEFLSLTANASGMNVVSPTWFTFEDVQGTLVSYADANLVEQAHTKGMQVWGCIQDDMSGSVSTSSVLAVYEARTKVIEQLLAAAAEVGMDGINVDFESITEESVGAYLQFLRELSIAAHAKGLVVSADNYVPLYTQYLNRSKQAEAIDYIVIMGYDEHYAGSAEAGSVASLSFVKQGIEDTLEQVPAEQVINGIPFFCRGWTTAYGEETPTSEAFGMEGAAAWANEKGIKLTWDSVLGQYTGQSDDGASTYSMWLEDEKSLEEKMKLIKQYKLAGVASWRLGLEKDDVWEIISRYVQ
ncbi:MAG: glycosyl hydrolase family 18 protein [Eubacteriales bacterium]|nr:glycosyl hydrolase family 18 protein [Eubacteriales bacterium]